MQTNKWFHLASTSLSHGLARRENMRKAQETREHFLLPKIGGKIFIFPLACTALQISCAHASIFHRTLRRSLELETKVLAVY